MITHESTMPHVRETRDPVIEHYKLGIDRTLIRHNLTLSPQERVENLIQLLKAIDEFQPAGREQRASTHH